MNISRKKINKIFGYVLFLLAFVFCGLVFSGEKAEAAPIVAVGNVKRDSSGKTTDFSIYIGYSTPVISSLEYTLSDTYTISSPDLNYSDIYKNDSTTCNQVGMESCEDVITRYDVSLSGKNYSINNNKLSVKVKASNKRWVVFVPVGGETEKSFEITYDNLSPSVSNVSVSRDDADTKTVFSLGDVIKLNLNFSEDVTVGENVKVNFKIGKQSRSAMCSKVSGVARVVCTYTVVSGDSGDLSVVNLENYSNIKDLYGNSVTGGSLSYTQAYSVDAINPKIESVTVVSPEGKYSSSKPLYIDVKFNEQLYASANKDNPNLVVKFGDGGKNRNCELYLFDNEQTLTFSCLPGSSDQGTLYIVKVENGNKYHDASGNVLNLDYPITKFNGYVADNGLPELENVILDAGECKSYNGKYYCSNGDKIKVNFKFNEDVAIDNQRLVQVKFGDGNNYLNPISASYDKTIFLFETVFVVGSKDEGVLTLEYDFRFVAENGNSGQASNSSEYLTTYADNKSPSVSLDDVKIANGELIGNEIYSKVNDVVEFIFTLDEVSEIKYDKEKIYLVDENNNKWYVGELCDVVSLESSLTDKTLNIKLTLANKEFSNKFKVKIEKDAIKDSFGYDLGTDFISELYVLDTKKPEVDVELVMPEYKSMKRSDGSVVLVSGNRVNVMLLSEHKDLATYCVSEKSECLVDKEFTLTSGKYEIDDSSFNKTSNGNYSLNIYIKDKAGNLIVKTVSFEVIDMFFYSNALGVKSKTHSITFDMNAFENGTLFNYKWFKEGETVSFNSAQVISKQDKSVVINGDNSFNGKYRLCLNDTVSASTFCSDYVDFDNKIDSFSVSGLDRWSASSLAANITFNDSSSIICVVVGKNVSSINCDSEVSENITIYRGSNAISPINNYTVSENGTYYFYIKDAAGNEQKLTEVVNTIDNDGIKIDVYNGNEGIYNPNLETSEYKNNHKFLVTFDRDIEGGSSHSVYKYFFTKANVNFNSEESFNYYYLNNSYKDEVTNGVYKYMYITAPDSNGIWNLHIMAKDEVNNVTFTSVMEICVDSIGPIIKLYNSDNEEVSGGSSNYISQFDYSILILDEQSYLNLNNIVYSWVDSSNDVVLQENYFGCPYGYTSCTISGSDISLEANFSPLEKYRLRVEAYDNAGNKGEFISGLFMIDKTPPSIEINIDENDWQEDGIVSFRVSKDNVATLDTIKYCLNDCLNESSEYDLAKFNSIDVTGDVVEKELNLPLINGNNTLYVYAKDIFGNYEYKEVVLKYDTVKPEIVVNSLTENNVVDLTGVNNPKLQGVLKDSTSKIKKYCVYLKGNQKYCEDDVYSNEYALNYSVNVNGEYIIEVVDYSGNSKQMSVNVIGVDKDPIIFELSTGLANGVFIKGSVNINIINMRKFMVEDVASRVYSIDYVILDYDYEIVDNASMFTSGVINVYSKTSSPNLITSFAVNDNKQYLVRIKDTANNVSYEAIKINCIDNDNPYIDNSQYADKSDRIEVTTQTGNNIKIFVSQDGANKVYKYSNETIKIRFGVDSLRDLSTGYNSYLALKMCFDDGNDSCVYNTYSVGVNLVDEYLINREIIITAPYNFSGVIRYYLVDAAFNASVQHSINVQYQYEVEDITGTVEDIDGNELVDEKQYSKVKVSLEGEEIEDIINKSGVKYALVASNNNLYTEFANTSFSGINSFLNKYSFTVANNKNMEITKSNVDGSYYLWVYINDLLGNYKLIKIGDLIKLDTIAPQVNEIGINIDRRNSSTYDLTVTNPISDYRLYIDINNTDSYQEVIGNTYSFETSTYNLIKVKLVDEALNESIVVTYNLDELQTSTYAKVYQEGNERIATLVIYNLVNGRNVDVQYIVTNLNDLTEYGADDLLSMDTCTGYEDTCKGKVTYSNSHGIYTLDLRSFNKDKRVIFYVRVDGMLLNLVEKNIVVDKLAPTVIFKETNPEVISSINGVYNFEVTVIEENINNLNNIRYVLTTNSNINVNNFNSIYNSCESINCARGVYDLDSDLTGKIVIDSISNKFNILNTGTYYLYTYVQDDYGNSSIGNSRVIYIDNTNPNVEYSLKNNQNSYQIYQSLDSEAYVGGAIKLRFSDNYDVKYFELYSDNELFVVCYIDALDGTSQNCTRNSSSEIGLVVENEIPYYYLDTGNYIVKVYDHVGNNFEGVINVDGSDPAINLYKSGVNQNSSIKIYNSLNDLTVSVNDNNFNYLTIDLINTNTLEVVNSASRYSYNSSMGKCLTDTEECEYGASLLDMIVGNTIQYNVIVLNVYDKALRHSTVRISYDNTVPVIWTIDVGEKVNIGGVLYDIGSDHSLDIEVGTNRLLTLDNLLSKIILDIDGKKYSEVKETMLFKKTIYKDSVLFNEDPFLCVGNYTIQLDYTDEAGNIAESKTIRLNVNDNVKPEFIYENSVINIDVQEEVEISGVIVKDNYGFDIGGDIYKEKNLFLSDGICKVTVSNNEIECDVHDIKISDTKYKFTAVGTYTFTYTINDLSNNTSTVTLTINVMDTKGPNMSSSNGDNTQFNVNVGYRINGELNVENVVVKYPNSHDNGDMASSVVRYLGVYAESKHGQIYKVEENYLVSTVDDVLTYRFTKIGKYYIRFSSSDSNGNVSYFDYIVVVSDIVAPVITGDGISDGTTVEIGCEETFSVENFISKYSITATDNYDSNILVSSKINFIDKFHYQVILTAEDSSSNATTITVNINIKDNVSPVVGELKLPSSTNSNKLKFEILGGSDNSANWWHEYSIEGGTWSKYDENSALIFGNGFNSTVTVCVRAVDGANNVSSNQSCKNISVDTKNPVVTGIKNAEISAVAVTVTVSDDNLESVKVWLNDELLELEQTTDPFVFTKLGKYRMIAKDTYGNEVITDFIIDIEETVGIINDINSSEYSVTSVDFDKRLLTKVKVTYDKNGYASYSTNLDDIRVNDNDMLYVLGAVPSTNSKFIMFSVSGKNIENYHNGINLIGGGANFKEGVNNQDFFVKIGNECYAYVLIKENQAKDPVVEVDDNANGGKENKALSTFLICVGSFTVLLIGYQVIKLRKRVRAA